MNAKINALSRISDRVSLPDLITACALLGGAVVGFFACCIPLEKCAEFGGDYIAVVLASLSAGLVLLAVLIGADALGF